MDWIHYAKNVLDPYMRKDVKSLLEKHIDVLPHYNFVRKGEPSTNFLEKVIRHLVGDTHHIEYWVRNSIRHTLWHVDGNELEQKRDWIRYGGYDPDQKVEFPLNTHVLYISVSPNMVGGQLLLLPYNTYVAGRGILDESYEPLENSRVIEIKPIENDMVIWTKPIYHATGEVVNYMECPFRLSLMFSFWNHIPEMYREHKHWRTYANPGTDTTIITDRNHPHYPKEPQPMEFKLI